MLGCWILKRVARDYSSSVFKALRVEFCSEIVCVAVNADIVFADPTIGARNQRPPGKSRYARSTVKIGRC